MGVLARHRRRPVAAGPVDHGRRLAHGLGQGQGRAGAGHAWLLWSPSGKTLWRAPRAVALASLPTFAFLLSLWLLVESRRPVDAGDRDHPAVRARHPGGDLRVVHLTQVRRALNQLAEEGQIKL
jgi:hypothetical protein